MNKNNNNQKNSWKKQNKTKKYNKSFNDYILYIFNPKFNPVLTSFQSIKIAYILIGNHNELILSISHIQRLQ